MRKKTRLALVGIAVGVLAGSGLTLTLAGKASAATPTVTGVSPASGPTSGGQTVVISGSGFTGATEVDFGGSCPSGNAAPSFTVNNDGQITATSPAGSAGTVDVQVNVAGACSAVSAPADSYTFVAPNVQLSPSGPYNDQQSITVSGSGFPVAANLPTGLQIIECRAQPALPTDANGCDASTVNQGFVGTDGNGHFSTSYTVSRLQTASGSTINCTSTAACALWVGADYTNDFNGANTHAFSPTFNMVAAQPTITSANHATFHVGLHSTFQVTTTGDPIPAISDGGAVLPAGVTFHDNGNLTASLAGTPAAGTAGTYPFTITANNGVGNPATQAFTLTVTNAPAFTSANNAAFPATGPTTFTITTVGTPPANIAESGPLCGGITFTNNGNGTATLSGTATQSGTFPITLTASNGVPPSASQNFTMYCGFEITTTSLPSATRGQSYDAFVQTSGGVPPVKFKSAGKPPKGLKLNKKTGEISGIPAAKDKPGAYSFTLTAQDHRSKKQGGKETSAPVTLTINLS